ncbi:hemoglobin/transferrin/lactoferrin receptor protein [Octadecabacter temperatus]|uniref:TonB-dependent heme receptor A n=1 Tax=Octadecabacter temperatus TaxID=1458307 RepID=A0A0K0Y5Z8_9RHOB|nr:TonB-dependent receptor [Octadecabacter temperatus]AKS46350.1 TonB-dependent heme receptor A precursor [Octadecabacter temperatus]SIO12364.1 hemoglobin/transferrin/lactoferrin receptor protein [Octadecabacter temperatus]
MTNLKRALLGATMLSSATLFTATSATAQDSVETPLGRIVLGTGTSGVAIDTPQAVTVVTEDEIDRAQATTVGELFDLVPGVQPIGSGRVAGESFNIRGVGELTSSDESRIIITVDGATKFYEQYRLGSFFSDPALYRQVEVLRGPASSTLYGAGALGGVINFETKDASDFLGATDTAVRTRLSYGSNSDEIATSVIVAERAGENMENLFALNYRTAGNYVDGDGNEIAGSEFDAISGLVKSRLTFGDDNAQALTVSYTRWNSDLDDTEYSQTGTLGFGTVDRDITDQTLAIRYENSVLGNNLYDLDVVLSYSDTNVIQSDSSLGMFSPSSLFMDSEYAYQTTSLKVENTAEFSGGNYEAYVTAGVQLSQQERVAETTSGVIGFHPEGTDTKVGVYAQGEFIFNDRLTVVPGIRADFISLEAGDGLAFADFEEVAVSPKLAAHYEINDTYAIFGSVARTQRAPTLDEIFSYDDSDGETYSPDLVSETATSAEFGASASYFGVFTAADALDVKATLFYSEVDDLIARDSTAGTPYYENVDAAKIYGLEVEAAYEADNMFVRAAYSDVRGEDEATGETLSSIPARNLSLTVGGRDQQRGLEYGWHGSFYDDISYGVGDDYDGYAVHDLFVDWQPQSGALQAYEVGFRVNNVLDTQYENPLAGDAGEGRSYEVSLTRTFEF